MTDIRIWAARAAGGLAGMCLWTQTAAGTPEPMNPAERGAVPFALAVVPALETPGPDRDVVGLRINLLAGRHRNVSFLDVGLLADIVDMEAYGVTAAGLWNSTGSAHGALQAAGAVNICYGDCYGAQLAGAHSRTEGTCVGLQSAAVCHAQAFKGLQIGFINRAGELSGVQVGVVNYAEQSEGIQFGLVNVMPDGRYPVMPIFNIGF